MSAPTPRQRQVALLAAAVAWALQEEAPAAEDKGAAWARTGHPHLRAVAWNPRKGTSGWRLAGRLDNHKSRRPDGI